MINQNVSKKQKQEVIKMTKISFNPEEQEIQVTRSIGKGGDGKITINREGGGAIEINLGVASAGLTTDYGGGISLAIAGQEVTWGREGGTIHIGIGGFEVDVEARDCIVTEIKSIAGIVVAQRTYPDPGCKLPDPPKPPKAEINVPGISGTLPGAVFDERGNKYLLAGYYSDPPRKFYGTDVLAKKITVTYDAAKAALDGTYDESYEDSFADRRYGPNTWEKVLKEFSSVFSFGGWHTEFVSYRGADLPQPGDTGVDRQGAVTITQKYNYYYYSSIGHDSYVFTSGGFNLSWAIGNVKPPPAPVKLIPNRPFLPTGNKPPRKDCCEEILDYLADFEEAFDVKRLLKDKFPVSNTFMAPECDPASVTEAKSYYEIMQCVFRMMAHGMIFEPRVKIKDADAAKAGDQEFKAKYLNATGWASAVSEALMEVKDDGNVATNMDIRNGFAVTQLMVGLADAHYKLDTVLDCFGIKLAHDTQTVETPYNLMIRLGKGFGGNNERQIDLNQDEATEALLPQLLQTKKNKIKTVIIHPRSRTIHEMLENIEAALARISNG